jgi:hypothetical protein
MAVVMRKISDLLPIEPALARESYAPVMEALRRDKKIHTPIQIVLIQGECVVDHGHHLCRAALDLGWDEVPCEESTPSVYTLEFMRWAVPRRLAAGYKGFATLPIEPTRSDRMPLLVREFQEFTRRGTSEPLADNPKAIGDAKKKPKHDEK